MWEMQNQVLKLMQRTGATGKETAEAIGVYASDLSRALNAEKKTPKQRLIITKAHRFLTERLEEQNRDLERAIARGEKALSEAEELESTGR